MEIFKFQNRDRNFQTVDFGRRVGAALPTEGGAMYSINTNQALGSAYPNVPRFSIYQN